jgi:hypothetical protein
MYKVKHYSYGRKRGKALLNKQHEKQLDIYLDIFRFSGKIVLKIGFPFRH